MGILIIIVALIIGLIPPIILYKWILKKSKDDKFKEICKKSFRSGIIAVFPVLLTSIALLLIGRLTGLQNTNPILYQFYYTVIVLAFAEELVKFLVFKYILKKNDYKYSWFDLTILMTLVGLGFECIETVVLAFSSNIIIMIIRGISLGHAGYGFIMGWFYGKMEKTGKNIYGVLSFLIPLILHGLYDFGLSPELIEVNENFAVMPVLLEVVSLVCVVLIIRFIRKRQDADIYREPLKSFK